MADRFADLVLDAPALRDAREATIRGMLYAAKETVTIVTREYEKELERATEVAARGKLWRAWASDVRPKGKRQIAREPAGFIYVNGGERTRGAIEFLTGRGTVTSKTGGYLAIPLPAAGSRGRTRDLTPGEWERQNGQRLQYVYRGGNKPALLVAKGTLNARSGSYRTITRKRTAADAKRGYQRGEMSVPIFVLVAPFAFQQKFSVESVMRGSGSRMAQVFDQQSRMIMAARDEVRGKIG
ncbi:DUF6441 family protein [Sphingomonas sp. SRS2]|uniref:DUF6441 family protein n=1 Tax=Sphingomonas sp. SRS2 TaxID=133190 RepID=UPI0006184DE9|nr:DUF6441 family protein [Sphingomonas sp. SRS2]KKC24853.1 hypothetical protein WP12_16580 [Sphingomonas sp. SRS2]